MFKTHEKMDESTPEKLILSRNFYTFETRDGVDYPVSCTMTNRELARMITRETPKRMSDLVGRRVAFDAAAPGIGRTAYRVTLIDAEGVWGVLVENTVRELTAADVY